MASIFKRAGGERRGLWLAPLICLLGGCGSSSLVAPVVTAASGAQSGTLHEGRRIYTQQCTSCHAAEPVHDYSRAEWAKILPDMAERTKLRPDQSAAVEAYVFAVLQTVPAGGRQAASRSGGS